MKDEFVKSIGVWGQRHYGYLKKHFPTLTLPKMQKQLLCISLFFHFLPIRLADVLF